MQVFRQNPDGTAVLPRNARGQNRPDAAVCGELPSGRFAWKKAECASDKTSPMPEETGQSSAAKYSMAAKQISGFDPQSQLTKR